MTISQVEARNSDAIEPAASKPNPLRRLQTKLRVSFAAARDRGGDGGSTPSSPELSPSDDDSSPGGWQRQQQSGGGTATAGMPVARASTDPAAQRTAVAAHALSHHVGQAPRHQEPQAKGQVVGRMGVGVASRGVGGLGTAQPAGTAVGAGDPDDYGVHPTCVPLPSPTCMSPGTAARAAHHHGSGLVSKALHAVKSKVTGHDGKPPRSEAGHVRETLTGSAKQPKPPPAIHVAVIEPVRSGSGSGDGRGGAEQLTASSAAERLPQEESEAAAAARAAHLPGYDIGPQQRHAARADAEADVAAATAAVGEVHASHAEATEAAAPPAVAPAPGITETGMAGGPRRS